MNQKDWDYHTAEFADDLCRKTHEETHTSGADANGLGKPPGSACASCVNAAKARASKLQKAHGVELGPEESAALLKRLGLDETTPDPALLDTIPDAEPAPGGSRGTH